MYNLDSCFHQHVQGLQIDYGSLQRAATIQCYSFHLTFSDKTAIAVVNNIMGKKNKTTTLHLLTKNKNKRNKLPKQAHYLITFGIMLIKAFLL